MARFYGTLQGNRGAASRLGTPSSGMTVQCATWSGAVRAEAYDRDGRDMLRVSLIPWHGHGASRLLYDGPANGQDDAT